MSIELILDALPINTHFRYSEDRKLLLMICMLGSVETIEIQLQYAILVSVLVCSIGMSLQACIGIGFIKNRQT